MSNQTIFPLKGKKINSVPAQIKFFKYCVSGELNSIKHLFSNQQINDPIDINTKDKFGRHSLSLACTYNHLDIVKYLLSDPDLKVHANIHFDNDRALINSSQYAPNIAKFLLSDPILKEHAHIHADGDHAIKEAFLNKNYDLFHYMVFDYNITVTPDIHEFMLSHEEVEKAFITRELNKKLNNNLSLHTASTPKNKI